MSATTKIDSGSIPNSLVKLYNGNHSFLLLTFWAPFGIKSYQNSVFVPLNRNIRDNCQHAVFICFLMLMRSVLKHTVYFVLA